MGIASLVLGIISFIIAVTFILAPLGVILAVIGLILGIVDTVKKSKAGQKKAISIVGLVMCAILFVVLIVESLFIGLGAAFIASNIDPESTVDDMATVATDVFNSKFEYYEGEHISGIRVRTLLSTVYTSNYGDTNHQIRVYLDNSAEDPSLLRNKINTSAYYDVEFSKDLSGYINTIKITSETPAVDGNNTVDPNSVVGNNEVNNEVSNNAIGDPVNPAVNNTTTGNQTTNPVSNVGKASTKANPLSLNDWGIASQYSSGSYIDIPTRVTKVTRGANAAKEVKAYCDSGSSIYKYSEPKQGMEWAVIDYDVDLTKVSNDTSARLYSSVAGTGDNRNIKYNGTTYIVTTMGMTSEYDKGKVVNSRFAVQLPIDCTDYIIVLGSLDHTQAFFAGK